jgi:hypothetical protein
LPEFLGSSAGNDLKYVTGRASAFRNDFRWNESGPEAGRGAPAIFSKSLDEASCKKLAVAFVKTRPVLGLAESAAGG